MSSTSIIQELLKHFLYEPTKGQQVLMSKLAEFLLDFKETSVFMLKGYAGTGKTTIVGSLVKVLPRLNKDSVLLAPTGRAAKVLSNYSNKPAFTIHKKIYIPRTNKDGIVYLSLQQNKHSNTLFIVDEASMIQDDTQSSDSTLFSGRNLLDDLFLYVYQGKNNKLMLIGDTAQLPPVHLKISPALEIDFLKSRYSTDILSLELTEVVRQSEDSGILANATYIRNKLKFNKINPPFFSISNFTDIQSIIGTELEDALNEGYSTHGAESCVVICRSNKRANMFNQEIRNRILFMENELAAGDFMMVVRNNYFWLPFGSKTGFIANGDIFELLRIGKIEEMYGFRFADVTIRLIDYPDEKELEVKIMLDTLISDTPSLNSTESRKLWDEVMKDYMDIPQKYKRYIETRNNPYLNALQVKFSYSLTCHKTQGGQWDTVFVDQGYVTDEMINIEFLRWLYTAVTRATKKLYLVNFNSKFFHN